MGSARSSAPRSASQSRSTTSAPPSPDQTIQLTIDGALQDEVEQVLAGVGAQYSPRGATAIVMDPGSGRHPGACELAAGGCQRPSAAPSYADENRAVMFNYEPGSTFKAFTVAGALEDHVVTPSTVFGIPSILNVADRQIHDAESHGDESLSVAQILKVSSNIGADEIGMRLGAQRFDYWVHQLRLRGSNGSRPPRRGARHRAPLSAVLGLLDGQPPDGTG